MRLARILLLYKYRNILERDNVTDAKNGRCPDRQSYSPD